MNKDTIRKVWVIVDEKVDMIRIYERYGDAKRFNKKHFWMLVEHFQVIFGFTPKRVTRIVMSIEK